DGMGGHNAGEVAARMAVDAAVEFIAGLHGCQPEHDAASWPFGFDPSLSRTGNLLRTAIHLGNIQILETATSSDEYAGMGTTIGSNGSCSRAAVFVKWPRAWSAPPWLAAAAITARPSSRSICPTENALRSVVASEKRYGPSLVGREHSSSAGVAEAARDVEDG